MKADDRTSSEGKEVPEHLARDLDRDQLSQLVREVNDAGVSYATMEKRAHVAGQVLSRSQFNKMASGTVKTSPSDTDLLAYAAGLNKPLDLVTRAAARQFLNYKATELAGYGDDVKVIVAHLAGMPQANVRRWRAMIEADESARTEHEGGTGAD
ncbi:hypothetical protein [Streptomyces graminilatus]|uniref:hypothetical protein n=1 Tax=Streptomyces graminilatus TaxID=1464070 RepID=UPI0006E22B48|nr:hypothetical protein [Streptomyces graminilatus]